MFYMLLKPRRHTYHSISPQHIYNTSIQQRLSSTNFQTQVLLSKPLAFAKANVVLAAMGLVCAAFESVECEPTESTCHALTRLAEYLNVDILFVGSFGRKKSDSVCDSDIHVLGSVADHSLRLSGVHVAVVRSTSYEIEDSSKFLIPVDLSDNSGVQLVYRM